MLVSSFGGDGGVWYFYYVHEKSIHTIVLVHDCEIVFSNM